MPLPGLFSIAHSLYHARHEKDYKEKDEKLPRRRPDNEQYQAQHDETGAGVTTRAAAAAGTAAATTTIIVTFRIRRATLSSSRSSHSGSVMAALLHIGLPWSFRR